MARGMAAGEKIVSQAQSRAFDEGADRIGLGRSRQSRERGKWILDPKTGKLVRPWEYTGPTAELAKNAPIASGRFYEEAGPSPIDHSEINSKRKYREHMRRYDVTNASDYEKTWQQAEKERAKAVLPGKEFLEKGVHRPQGYDAKEIKEAIGRSIYELKEKARRR